MLKNHAGPGLGLALLLMLVLAGSDSQAQYFARLDNARIEFVGILDGESTIWESRNLSVAVQKGSGEFKATIPLVELIRKQTASGFEPLSEEERRQNADVMFKLSGTLPINQILNNNQQIQTVAVQMTTTIGERSAPAVYVLRITSNLQDTRRIYRVMADGMIDLSDFDLPQLSGFEHEIQVSFDFTGM